MARPNRTFTEWLRKEAMSSRCTLLAAYEDLDRLQYMEKPDLERKYMEHFGAFEEETIREEMECELLQKKKEMIQAALNRRGPIDEGTIDAQIDKLRQEMLKEAEGGGTPPEFRELTGEQAGDLQAIYHRIVQYYHPQTHPELTEVHRELFKKAQDAYRRRDLEALRLIYDMLLSADGEVLDLAVLLELLKNSVEITQTEPEEADDLSTDYALTGKKEWLQGQQGRMIHCRSFSAQQQAAALRIKRSVNHQHQSQIDPDQVKRVFDTLRGYLRIFISKAPRFSQQPIEEAVFGNSRVRNFEDSPENIARRLYGDHNFAGEMDAYFGMVVNGEAYRSRLREAVSMLTDVAYTLPVMAVRHFLTELGTLIDEIVQDAFGADWSRPCRFALTADGLAACFASVDQMYLNALEAKLAVRFLRDACDQVKAVVDQEWTPAAKSVASLDKTLKRFCFVSEDAFEADADAELLGWKQITELQAEDVRHRDISWTVGSLHNLQSNVMSKYALLAWLCSERLCNLAMMDGVADSNRTKAVQALDERLVWAIWAEEYKEEG